MKGVISIIDKKTGERKTAVYAANRLGNMRYNVEGRFITDMAFGKRYIIVEDESSSPAYWRVCTTGLFEEIVNCGGPGVAIMRLPLTIMANLLAKVAERALELHDPMLNALMCQLALYEQSNPQSPQYDKEMTDTAIQTGMGYAAFMNSSVS